MITTAQHGNPRQASRGAAVTLAKQELGDAIDARLNLDIDGMEMELLARFIGVPVEQARARLDEATLGELHEWTAAVKGEA